MLFLTYTLLVLYFPSYFQVKFQTPYILFAMLKVKSGWKTNAWPFTPVTHGHRLDSKTPFYLILRVIYVIYSPLMDTNNGNAPHSHGQLYFKYLLYT